MQRRDFLGVLGGAAASRPLVARAQQGERMRRVGALLTQADGDREALARLGVFVAALAELDWADGQNLRVEPRWAAGHVDGRRRIAADLAAFAPDVVLTVGSGATGAMLQATRAVPIVFVLVPDPVGAGLVDSLARPGGNATGFAQFEYDMSEVAGVAQASGSGHDPRCRPARCSRYCGDRPVRRNAGRSSIAWRGIAPSGCAECRRNRARSFCLFALARRRDDRDRERVSNLSSRSDYQLAGSVSTASGPRSARLRRSWRFDFLWRLALGAVPASGELCQSHLQGEKPADLPVQAPTKYELVVNLKTAKALGLPVPATLLARADEFIE